MKFRYKLPDEYLELIIQELNVKSLVYIGYDKKNKKEVELYRYPKLKYENSNQ
jgi:hypothetical protein